MKRQGGGVKGGLFFLELKLDDFTSGFRVSYADMAGGWEEVAAAAGWTGTGAGTGVELNKHNNNNNKSFISTTEYINMVGS